VPKPRSSNPIEGDSTPCLKEIVPLLSIHHATIDNKSFVPERVKQLIELLKYPEVQTFLKLFIDNSIVTSDLNILKRLATIENKLGFNDLLDSDEPTIPEQLSILADRIAKIVNEPRCEPENSPTTKTESRAHLLVAKLKGMRGKGFLSSQEIVQFLKHGIEERYKVGDKQNVRQVKKEVLQKIVELFPDMQLDKKKYGRREVRLILGT
jgi:hypothetical protein